MKQIVNKLKIFIIVLCAMAIVVPHSWAAGITVYKEGEKYVKLGGHIHLQYHNEDPDKGSSTDTVFFRRVRLYIEGSLYKDWKGRFAWDMGKANDDNEIELKDAYMQYIGFKGIKISIGNANFPFSRQKLTSSKKQQLVERTFAGDHNYGTPDRQAGIHIAGHFADKMITYGVAGASASIDPDSQKIDFDTPINKKGDFNQGWIIGGRIDIHPFGHLEFSQGDFMGDTKATIGVAAFTWKNDDDNNTMTTAGVDTSGGSKPDVDLVNGFEVSSAFRFMGVSIDAEYNFFNSDTIDSTVTKGIYKKGATALINFSVEGGYMVFPETLEIVAGYQFQDADNYAATWTRTSVGANWFLKKHDIKVQFTYQIGKNLDGVKGSDENEAFVQAQYVF